MSARRKHIPERQLWFLSLKKENAYPHIFLAASPLVIARFAREFFLWLRRSCARLDKTAMLRRLCRGSRVPCVFWGARVQVSSWCIAEQIKSWPKPPAKTKLENMDKTMQKLQHIGSLKDLRPQRDSVGVRSSVSGLKSECADNFSSEPDLWFALRDFVPEWNSLPGTRTGVNSRRADSRWHDILWWDHVNKYRTMRGNRSELARGRKSPRCHVNTPNRGGSNSIPWCIFPEASRNIAVIADSIVK